MELPQLETRFEPLRENYRALAKFEVCTCRRHHLCMCASSGSLARSREAQVPVPESEAVQLEALEASLQNVQAALVAANGTMDVFSGLNTGNHAGPSTSSVTSLRGSVPIPPAWPVKQPPPFQQLCAQVQRRLLAALMQTRVPLHPKPRC